MAAIGVSSRAMPATAVSTTSRAGTTLPVLIFAFAFYTNLSVIGVKFHGVPQSMGSAVVLLLLLPLIHYTLVERKPLVLPPALPLILLFLSVLFLSAVLSGDPEGSRDTLELYVSEGLLLFFLVVNAIRTPELLTRVVSVLLVAGAFLGALSLIQEVTGDYQNSFGGFAQVDRLDEGGGFDVGAEGHKELRPRLGGPIGSENRYAQILLVLVPLALYRVLKDPKWSRRLGGAVAAALILSGIALTFSRGAAVGLAVVVLLMAVLRELRLRHLLVAVIASVVLVTAVAPEYVTRLTSLGAVAPLVGGGDESSAADGALRGRQTSNLAAWYTFGDHPIIGVGPGQYFREFSQTYANRLDLRYFETDRRAHNMYLELAADAGVLGVLAFAGLIGITLLRLHRLNRRYRSERPELSMLAGSFFFALVGYLATAIFLHLSYQRYFWVLLALANAAIWILEREPQPQAQVDGRRAQATFAPSANGA